MAIARGQESSAAGVARKLYKGMAAVKVLAVNPDKKTLEKLYGHEFENEPVYLTEAEVDGKKYPAVRISFVVATDPEKNNGIEAMTNHVFFLQKRYRKGSKSGKFQVIDEYGRTAWATQEEAQAKKIPTYQKADGTEFPANISADYRPAYVGEEQLTLFIKNLLNIPNVQSYVNGEWIDNPKVAKEDCLVRLDKIEEYFKGNFAELKEVISYQPDNLVKIAWGIKHTDDNRTFQTTYDGMCFKNAVTDYSKLDAEWASRRAAGGLQNIEFSIADLEEYTVAPDNTEALAGGVSTAEAPIDDNPWG